MRIAALALAVFIGFNHAGDVSVVSLLEPIRQRHHLPALGAALMTSRGVVMTGVAGVRKTGSAGAATIDDQWHLGSDTKAMTAVIIATLIEHGKLRWEETLGEIFPELASVFSAEFRAI